VGEGDPVRAVTASIRALLAPSGLELCELSWAQGPGGGRLRLVVDRPGGVTLDGCASASRLVSRWLDLADPLPGPYTLEVSSPGAERSLEGERALDEAIGHRIRLELDGGAAAAALAGPGAGVPPARWFVEGWLVAVDPTWLELEVRPGRRRAGRRRRIERAAVLAARRLVDL